MQYNRKFAKQCSAILIVALVVSVFFSLAVYGQAATIGTVNDNANLRAGPGTSYTIAGSAGQGTIVTIVSKDDTGEWYQLDNSQWIAAFLVDLTTTTPQASPTAASVSPAVQEPVSTSLSVAVTDNANLRAGPDITFPVVGHATVGQVLMVIGKNSGGTWYQLADQTWIAAFLVNDSSAQSGNTSPTNQQVDSPAPTATFTPTPMPQPAPTENPRKGQRYGAICADGSTSGATGRGACSHHGGVAQWLVYE